MLLYKNQKGEGLMPWLIALFVIGFIFVVFFSDDEVKNTTITDGMIPVGAGKSDLVIVAGSENKALQPVIEKWADDNDINIYIQFLGSVDIYRSLQQGKKSPYDAVWPANHLWIELGDTQHVVKHEQSIMRSPIVLGLKKSIAQKLGWTDKEVSLQDILDASEQRKFRLSMTSATQSNSGTSAYLGFLYAMANYPDTLKMTDIENPDVQAKVKRMLATVNRSSGSSGWLKEAFQKNPDRFDAMFNYEAMIIEANQHFTKNKQAPLCAIYPKNGLIVADSPLGYIDKGNADKEALFLKLQQYLLSEKVQQQIETMGRRTGLIGATVSHPDKKIWNPDWCINTEKTIASIPVPEEKVIQAALDIYQTELRKPSLTVWVLDVSGSMMGEGIIGLRQAMMTLLDPIQSKQHLLQASKKDITYIIPFNHEVVAVWKIEGNKTPENILQSVRTLEASGGTDLYAALITALEQLKPYHADNTLWNYLPSIVAMTDGLSQEGNLSAFQLFLKDLSFASDIPIHAIAFGDADVTQLEALAKQSSGRLFDSKGNLPQILRKAKGYN